MTEALELALAEWRVLLSPELVITEPSVLAVYNTATYATTAKAAAVLKPDGAGAVQKIVGVAAKYGVPLYPISTGKNWGYGSSVPTSAGAVIIDMSQMRAISDYNSDLGYVKVQPGVTQYQLYEFLQQQGGKYWMDATGASGHCSILGNTLERGFGHTPYGDHFSNTCGFQVVLANGELIQTGFGRLPNAKAANVYKWGVGPYLDGLFTQSNLGIVTEMTLWLMPKPECYLAFFCSVPDHEFANLIEVLRPLRMDGTIKSAMHIANADKAVQAFQQYPWSEITETPLPREYLKRFCNKYDIADWSASGALYGSRLEVMAAKRKLKKALSKIKNKKTYYLSDLLIKMVPLVKRPYKLITGVDLDEVFKMLMPVYNLKRGVPTEYFMLSTYWRKKFLPRDDAQSDPNRDKCGLLWIAPIAPMTGRDAVYLADIVSSTLLKYKFEPAISMTLLTERCIDCVVSIIYDREIIEEEKRAFACHHELKGKLIENGYYPYRLSTESMGDFINTDSAVDNMLLSIKKALDKGNIISPDRYIGWGVE